MRKYVIALLTISFVILSCTSSSRLYLRVPKNRQLTMNASFGDPCMSAAVPLVEVMALCGAYYEGSQEAIADCVLSCPDPVIVSWSVQMCPGGEWCAVPCKTGTHEFNVLIGTQGACGIWIDELPRR